MGRRWPVPPARRCSIGLRVRHSDLRCTNVKGLPTPTLSCFLVNYSPGQTLDLHLARCSYPYRSRTSTALCSLVSILIVIRRRPMVQIGLPVSGFSTLWVVFLLLSSGSTTRPQRLRPQTPSPSQRSRASCRDGGGNQARCCSCRYSPFCRRILYLCRGMLHTPRLLFSSTKPKIA